MGEKSEPCNNLDSLEISHIMKVEINEDAIVKEEVPVLDECFPEKVEADASLLIEEPKPKKKRKGRRKKDEFEKKKGKLESILKRGKPKNKYSRVEEASCDYCEKIFPSHATLSLHIDVDHPSKKEEFDVKY